ncbi:glycosyltransferase family 2 protein [Alteromonas gracilis]|uniref:glycosyltransferase family 2 protein n=1 Tax=Alteromonas gracilis TaxID=1479524 RepID=UPI002FE16848
MKQRVLVSILNWNGTEDTVACTKSLIDSLIPNELSVTIRIVDNGSNEEQRAVLEKESQRFPDFVDVFYSNKNTGFAGGQNINIRFAQDNHFDYVWLLNNDTVVPHGALEHLVTTIQREPQAGAISPVIVRMGNKNIVDFCGAVHDWDLIDTIRCPDLKSAPEFCQTYKDSLWAMGTALLLKTEAVNDVGLLNEKLFAYYEDDDYGTRLINKNWRTLIDLDVHVEHACFDGDMYKRQPYFFYLMNRNALLLAIEHTPSKYRKFLKLKFADRAASMARKLKAKGENEKANACILGYVDGLVGNYGAPVLDRPLPLWAKALIPLSTIWNAFK